MLLRALTSGLTALLLISGPTLAADIVIQQGTPLSLAEVVTGANGDTVSIDQAGTVNGAKVIQYGIGTSTAIRQSGLQNSASITQFGNSPWATVGQFR